MIYSGGLGEAGEKALDFEGRKWEPFFTGDYSEAKKVMARLDTEHVPNRLALPHGLPTFFVVVEVMHRWTPQARKAIATDDSGTTD